MIRFFKLLFKLLSGLFNLVVRILGGLALFGMIFMVFEYRSFITDFPGTPFFTDKRIELLMIYGIIIASNIFVSIADFSMSHLKFMSIIMESLSIENTIKEMTKNGRNEYEEVLNGNNKIDFMKLIAYPNLDDAVEIFDKGKSVYISLKGKSIDLSTKDVISIIRKTPYIETSFGSITQRFKTDGTDEIGKIIFTFSDNNEDIEISHIHEFLTDLFVKAFL